MHAGTAAGEIRADTVIRQREVGDVAIAEFLAQQMRDAAPASQGYKGKSIISQRFARDESTAILFEHLLVGPVGGDAGADNRADRSAADAVDLLSRLAQRAHHADMCEAARTAARQHQANTAPDQQARDALDIERRTHMVMLRAVHLGEPRRRGAPANLAIVMHQHEMTRTQLRALGADKRRFRPWTRFLHRAHPQHEPTTLPPTLFPPSRPIA